MRADPVPCAAFPDVAPTLAYADPYHTQPNPDPDLGHAQPDAYHYPNHRDSDAIDHAYTN